jgi:hypothetical protein
MNLRTAVPNEKTGALAEAFLAQLIVMARLPANTDAHVFVAPFEAALAGAPGADRNLVGLSREPDLAFSQPIVEIVGRSCVFVRDSGAESAPA